MVNTTVPAQHWGQNWWQQQQKKNAAKAAEWKPPEKCTFCNKKIEEGDWLNAGYDRHMIYAETCDHLHCKQWLKWKVRRKK